jgi:hypothetical protein
MKTRAVISICAAIFSLILLLSKCHNRSVQTYQAGHSWTPALEQQMRDVFYTQIQTLNASDSAKRAYADCCFDKIKEMFPNGLSSLNPEQMTDSVKIAFMKECAKCSAVLTRTVDIWTPELIQQLKLKFYAYPEIKLIPEAAKSEYVDCLTFRVKTRFPNGMSTPGKDSIKKFIEKAREGCLISITNKYKKHKVRDTLSGK